VHNEVISRKDFERRVQMKFMMVMNLCMSGLNEVSHPVFISFAKQLLHHMYVHEEKKIIKKTCIQNLNEWEHLVAPTDTALRHTIILRETSGHSTAAVGQPNTSLDDVL
jgi:hypothetical protein